MKSLKKLFEKSYIQDIYDFTCLLLEQGFHAFQIDEENKITTSSHVAIWNNENHLNAVKYALSQKLSAEDYEIFQNRKELHQLLLMFHIKEAILKNVKKTTRDSSITKHYDRMNYVNIEHSMTTDISFSNWVKTNEHVIEKSEHFKKMFTEKKHLLSGNTSFFFLLKHNHENKIIYTEDKIQLALKNLREKFALKNILIYPGQCKDILKALEQQEQQLEKAARMLDIPNKAIGLKILNVTFFLDEENYNMSLIFSQVAGYFFNTKSEFNISIRYVNDSTNTIIHEYGHFISSIIYEKTKEREKNTFNNLDKWDSDKKKDVKSFYKAHALKLDWIGQTINLSNWETLQNLRENLSQEDGFRHLENTYISTILKDVITPSKDLLNSPILFNTQKYMGRYHHYHEDIMNKIVSFLDSFTEITIPKENIHNAIISFLRNSSFAYYPYQIKNPYLKSLLHLSVFDRYVSYIASPEEIWARSFEALVNTDKQEMIKYNPCTKETLDLSNLQTAIDTLYNPEFNLISCERLHILYILKNVYSVLLPEVNFIPEENKCYKNFIINNPNDLDLDTDSNIKKKLFNNSIKSI